MPKKKNVLKIRKSEKDYGNRIFLPLNVTAFIDFSEFPMPPLCTQGRRYFKISFLKSMTTITMKNSMYVIEMLNYYINVNIV